jgi:hypothetical protein
MLAEKIPKIKRGEPELEPPVEQKDDEMVEFGFRNIPIRSDQEDHLNELAATQESTYNFEDPHGKIAQTQTFLLTNFLAELEQGKRRGIRVALILDYLSSVWLTSKDMAGSTKVDHRELFSVRAVPKADSDGIFNRLLDHYSIHEEIRNDQQTHRYEIDLQSKTDNLLLRYVSPSGVTLVKYIIENFKEEIYVYLLNLIKWEKELLYTMNPGVDNEREKFFWARWRDKSFYNEFIQLVVVLHSLLGYCDLYKDFPELVIFEQDRHLDGYNGVNLNKQFFAGNSPYSQQSLAARAEVVNSLDTLREKILANLTLSEKELLEDRLQSKPVEELPVIAGTNSAEIRRKVVANETKLTEFRTKGLAIIASLRSFVGQINSSIQDAPIIGGNSLARRAGIILGRNPEADVRRQVYQPAESYNANLAVNKWRANQVKNKLLELQKLVERNDIFGAEDILSPNDRELQEICDQILGYNWHNNTSPRAYFEEILKFLAQNLDKLDYQKLTKITNYLERVFEKAHTLNQEQVDLQIYNQTVKFKKLEAVPEIETVELDLEYSNSAYIQNLDKFINSKSANPEKYILEDLDIQTKIDWLINCDLLAVEKKKMAFDTIDDIEHFFDYLEQIKTPILALESLPQSRLNKKEVLTKLVEKINQKLDSIVNQDTVSFYTTSEYKKTLEQILSKYDPQQESLVAVINQITDTFLRISLKNLHLDLTEVIVPFLQTFGTSKDRINNTLLANQFKQKLKEFIESPQPLAQNKTQVIEFLNEYHSWCQWNKFGNNSEEKLKESREQIDQKENPEKYIYASISPESRYPFEAIPSEFPFSLEIQNGKLKKTQIIPDLETSMVSPKKPQELTNLQDQIPDSLVMTYFVEADSGTTLYPPSFNVLKGVFVENPQDVNIRVKSDTQTNIPQQFYVVNKSKRNIQVKILFSPANLPERPNGSRGALYSNFHPGESVWQNRDEKLKNLQEYQVEKLKGFIKEKSQFVDTFNNSKFIQAGNKIEDIKPYHYWYIFEDILPQKAIQDLVAVHKEYYDFLEDYGDAGMSESDLNGFIKKVSEVILESGVIYKSNEDFPNTTPEKYYTNALEKVFVRQIGQCQDLDDVVHFILFNMGMVVSSQGGYVSTSNKKVFGDNTFAKKDTHVESCVYLQKSDLNGNIWYERIHLNPVALAGKDPNSKDFDGGYDNDPDSLKLPRPKLPQQTQNTDNSKNQTSQKLNELRKKLTAQVGQRLLQANSRILPKLPTIASSLALTALISASGNTTTIQKNPQNTQRLRDTLKEQTLIQNPAPTLTPQKQIFQSKISTKDKESAVTRDIQPLTLETKSVFPNLKIVEPAPTEQQSPNTPLVIGGLATLVLVGSKIGNSKEKSPQIPQDIDYKPTTTQYQNQFNNNASANVARPEIKVNEQLLLGNLQTSEDERSLNNIQTANNTQLEPLKIIEKHTKYETLEKQRELNEQLTNNFLQTLFFANQIAQKYKYGVEKSNQFYGQNYFASPEFTEFLKNPDQTQQEIIRLIHLFSSKKITIQNDYRHNQSIKSSDYLGINGSTGIMQNSFLFGNLGSFVNNNSFYPQFRDLTPESKANLKKFLIIIRKILNQLLNSEIEFSDQNEDYKEKILSGGKVKLELDRDKVEEICNNLLIKLNNL